ncbi:DUF5053 domain-containing protein [Muribaculum intestinale]|uniref:DUF5053 domain-containing protein n=1 Tax=Muribaculum intestinale TaxID=1796646 RepID=A0A4S2G4H5_9BACT|nr:DUF5053 domain-containing protein [Muribaculum intestinale]MYM13711.1 DUF5053 domain-containing protein [Muribaculum intestinale]TGX83759.1 DUF5053 domain-containing protein [Muribaculum intestinale]TGY76691.1 DUF5053 domain-containing protein [Muribaculum intestinale]
MKERIEKWKQMEAAGDSAATDYLKEITAQAQTEGKIQEMTEALQALMASADKHLDNVENSLNAYTMHEQMGALTEVVNLAYIARHYFGKTRQWLYQRLKGQIVNGKPAAFTESEEATFIKALHEIGLQLATFTQRV